MFHGGLRYLEQLEFGLVRGRYANANCRCAFARTWSGPAVPLPTDQATLGAAVRVGWSVPLRPHGRREVGPRPEPGHAVGALRVAPALKRNSLIGGIRYYDTVVDDARHSLTVARTAAHYGAVIRTSTQVVGFLREADRVMGCACATPTPVRSPRSARIASSTPRVCGPTRCRHCRRSRATSRSGRRRVCTSSCRATGSSATAIILRTANSVLFVIPWETHWIIGTTDTDWNLDLAHPAATHKDIDYILDRVSEVLVSPLTHDDIGASTPGCVRCLRVRG